MGGHRDHRTPGGVCIMQPTPCPPSPTLPVSAAPCTPARGLARAEPVGGTSCRYRQSPTRSDMLNRDPVKEGCRSLDQQTSHSPSPEGNTCVVWEEGDCGQRQISGESWTKCPDPRASTASPYPLKGSVCPSHQIPQHFPVTSAEGPNGCWNPLPRAGWGQEVARSSKTACMG